MSKPALKVGDRVWWTDPDDGACSGPGTVTKSNGEVVSVTKDDLGEVEASARELKKLTKPLKKFSVDIQHTEEFTYQVSAPTLKDAEALAFGLYRTGDDNEDHNEIVGDATITNSEEIG